MANRWVIHQLNVEPKSKVILFFCDLTVVRLVLEMKPNTLWGEIIDWNKDSH